MHTLSHTQFVLFFHPYIPTLKRESLVKLLYFTPVLFSQRPRVEGQGEGYWEVRALRRQNLEEGSCISGADPETSGFWVSVGPPPQGACAVPVCCPCPPRVRVHQ